MAVYYFGTSLTDKGHFFWELNDYGMLYHGLSFPKDGGISVSRYKEWPFNPEDMPIRQKGESLGWGDVKYYRENGYTICAIEGSCKDDRSGSRSVFFTDEKLTWGELAVKIMSLPMGRKIINHMPFEVKWGLRDEIIKSFGT